MPDSEGRIIKVYHGFGTVPRSFIGNVEASSSPRGPIMRPTRESLLKFPTSNLREI